MALRRERGQLVHQSECRPRTGREPARMQLRRKEEKRAAAKAEKHGSEEAWKRHEILKRKVLDKPKLTAAAKQEKLQQKL